MSEPRLSYRIQIELVLFQAYVVEHFIVEIIMHVLMHQVRE